VTASAVTAHRKADYTKSVLMCANCASLEWKLSAELKKIVTIGRSQFAEGLDK